jgi:hypothetical protein
MNFVQLREQRINLNQIVTYWPTERYVMILNKPEKWYGLSFAGVDGKYIDLEYRTNLAARDTDLMTLDFVCVKNKRGNVKELQKKQSR